MLICDGHDSHISAAFVRHCLDNHIDVFLLLPHSSHLLQPLDVGIFGPLKTAMSAQINTIFRTGIMRLQKVEWIENYMKAREKAMVRRNIIAGWRGAGLWPIDCDRILEQISEDEITPPPQFQPISQTSTLLTSSPPDALILHSTNVSLNTEIKTTNASTPIRNHIRRLSGIAEQLHADNIILKRENTELMEVVNARKERASGKRIILKGVRFVTTEYLYQELEKSETESKEKKKKGSQKKRKRMKIVENKMSNNEQHQSHEKDQIGLQDSEMRDCIIVQTK